MRQGLSTIKNTILIIGGGVAGLYLRASLWANGYNSVLVDRGPLGTGQTIASQGILHRGIKYALSQKSAAAASALAAAHDSWDAALAGTGIPDLRNVSLLTRTMHLWTKPGLLGSFAGSLTASAASLAMKSGVQKLSPDTFPPAFAGAPVSVWEVTETCIDPSSLLTALAAAAPGPIITSDTRSLASLTADFSPSLIIFAAGTGNEDLLHQSGHTPATFAQRRPLHMVVMRSAPFDLFAHCLQEFSDKPRLTITTSHSPSHRTWYIGGLLAEVGISRDASTQVQAARAQLEECLPWVTLPPADCFSTHRVDRAEGRTESSTRPDGPVIHAFPATASLPPHLAVWPTKLALAPTLFSYIKPHLPPLMSPTTISPDPVSIPLGTAHPITSPITTPAVAPIPWDP